MLGKGGRYHAIILSIRLTVPGILAVQKTGTVVGRYAIELVGLEAIIVRENALTDRVVCRKK